MWPFTSTPPPSSYGMSAMGTQTGPSYMSGMLTPRPQGATSWLTGSIKTILILVAGAVTLLVGVIIYNSIQKSKGQPGISLTGDASSSGDQVPAPVSGKIKTTIPAANAPIGANGSFGLQYWMYIADWDYNFSKEKTVIKRVGTAAASTDVSPHITLHPTDNSLQVKVAIYPTGGAGSTSATGDSFTCTVENVPLQRWFAVSVTVFQRNVDIYIDGRLVKSCVLPGIPKPVLGAVYIGDDTDGFSGSICNFKSYTEMIGPDAAKAFAAAGTNCQAPAGPTTSAPADSTVASLFGYTFRFSTLDKAGKELSNYVL